MYACICRTITEAEVRMVGRAGVIAPGALIRALGLDDAECCGQCVEHVDEFVTLALDGFRAGPSVASPPVGGARRAWSVV